MCDCWTKNIITIDKDNAFKFSVPVKSRVIVNQVNVSYCELVPETAPQVITVRRDDCEVTAFSSAYPRPTGAPANHTHSVVATVSLGDRIYDEITDIMADDFAFIRIQEATVDSLTLAFTRVGNAFRNIEVRINS